GGATKSQTLLEYPDGSVEVALGEIQVAEAPVGNERFLPSSVLDSEAERLFPMASTLGELSERTQNKRQPCPRVERYQARAIETPTRDCFHVPRKQSGCPGKVANKKGRRREARGCDRLRARIIERNRHVESLPAGRNSAIKVSELPARVTHQGQHAPQLGS